MSNRTFILSLLLLSLSLILMLKISSRGVPKVIQTNLENIPMKIGEYKAVKDDFSQSVYEELNADRHVYRHYVNPEGQVINLYIGYYGTAKGGRTGHNPYACLPGAGWGIIRDETIQVFDRYKQASEEVKYTITRKGDQFVAMIHWYQSAGTEVLGSGLEQNIQRFINMVFKNRNDGAFVRISAATNADRVRKAGIELKKFSEKILLLLPDYWPEESY